MRAEIVDRQPSSTQECRQRLSQRDSSVIAGQRNTPDVGNRHEGVFIRRRQSIPDHRDAAFPEGVLRQRCDVAPAFEHHRFTGREHARVGFGYDGELLHMSELRPVDTLLSAEQIQTRVAELALEIRRDFPDGLHLVAVLKGAFMFLSDLVRHMDGQVSLDFMAVSSYAKGTTTSGEVRLLKDLDTTLDGKNVVIVEDIVDTGLTLTYLQDILRARGPKTLRTAGLLSKPSRRQVDVKVEYIGFTIEDRFVVGYGLDYAEQYRNLPYIAVVGS